MRENTGIKDRKGQEVHEGDILDFMMTPDPKDKRTQYRYVVKRENDLWVMEGAPIKVRFWPENAICSQVVGNVYDNPELEPIIRLTKEQMAKRDENLWL